MEINITKLFFDGNPKKYSASIMELGDDAAPMTWNNALNSEYSFVTEDNKQFFIRHFEDFGAWDDIHEWPIKEINALFIQLVAGDIRELELFDTYEEYENSDQVAHNIFKTEKSEWYFELSY